MAPEENYVLIVANYSAFIAAENSVLLLPISLYSYFPKTLHFYLPITRLCNNMYLDLFSKLKNDLAFYLQKLREFDSNNGFNNYKISESKEKRAKIQLLFNEIDSNVQLDLETRSRILLDKILFHRY